MNIIVRVALYIYVTFNFWIGSDLSVDGFEYENARKCNDGSQKDAPEPE